MRHWVWPFPPDRTEPSSRQAPSRQSHRVTPDHNDALYVAAARLRHIHDHRSDRAPAVRREQVVEDQTVARPCRPERRAAAARSRAPRGRVEVPRIPAIAPSGATGREAQLHEPLRSIDHRPLTPTTPPQPCTAHVAVPRHRQRAQAQRRHDFRGTHRRQRTGASGVHPWLGGMRTLARGGPACTDTARAQGHNRPLNRGAHHSSYDATAGKGPGITSATSRSFRPDLGEKAS